MYNCCSFGKVGSCRSNSPLYQTDIFLFIKTTRLLCLQSDKYIFFVFNREGYETRDKTGMKHVTILVF